MRNNMTTSSSTNGVISTSSKPSKWISSFTKKPFKLISLSLGSQSPPQTPTASPPTSPSISNFSKGSTKLEDEFQQVFRYLDGDCDEKISNLELRAYFGSIGEYMSYEEAQIVIDDLDKDGDGLLDFQEFMELLKREDDDDDGGDSRKAEDLKKAFEMYEVEKGCGCITPKSLQRMLHRLGDEKSYDECAAMIQVFDLDDNGMLDFHEFHTMMVA